MAVSITVNLTDYQEQVLAWQTARINALRANPANLVPPVTDPPQPLTPRQVFLQNLGASLAVAAAEFEAWKVQRRAEAIGRADPAVQAAIDAQLGLDGG